MLMAFNHNITELKGFSTQKTQQLLCSLRPCMSFFPVYSLKGFE